MNVPIILEKRCNYMVKFGFCPPKEIEQISLTVDSVALQKIEQISMNNQVPTKTSQLQIPWVQFCQ